MDALLESFNIVSAKARELNTKIQTAESEISKLASDRSEETAARIAKLEEQLTKIDEYMLRIKGFQELAKKNLDSQNVLTIDAPPGYRVNMNRLRNWAMMIDPTSPNDPYAQRVYVVAKCDECFLNKKKEEFNERIAQLKGQQTQDNSNAVEAIKQSIAQYKEELRQFAYSEEVAQFAKQISTENAKYWYRDTVTAFSNPSEPAALIAPGSYDALMQFDSSGRTLFKSMIGDCFDEKKSRVRIPATFDNSHEYVMTVTCAPSRRKRLDRALQNLVLETINNSPAGTRKVYVIDGVRFNSSSMGSLRQLEGTYALEQIPRNPDQLTSTLEEIVSSFGDTDEMLELYDSVTEYNAQADRQKQIPLSTVILFGWPNAYSGRDRELIQRIMTNFERYGISLVTIAYGNAEREAQSEKDEMPEYARQNAIHISMLQNETAITNANGEKQFFSWYEFSGEITQEYVASINSFTPEEHKTGNEYIKRYSLTDIPPYVREYKKLELPFGINGKDEEGFLSFENENFATYLVGASRSGKSTLLHTLIAGLIRNYHPDNLELWLADFKQLEFKRYINHLPPHVKYVLLDESSELVFDLIDKLTNEMMERQKLFSRLGVQRIDQVDTTSLDKPLPVIFVILDEFSIMSQSIAESPIYKLRLQNILAKGAALGIKFLFSSQTFTTGVAGLTATARAQIQQRIAMKGSKEEISETLELSSNLKTEQVRNWMDALPPHYALVKFRSGADTLPQVKRYLVMYFKDYEPRDRMIKQISDSMVISETYKPTDIRTYVNKHPVLVDGNTFDAYVDNEFFSHLNAYKEKQGNDFSGDEVLVSFGTPRLMERIKLSVLSSETRENILLISRAAEQACAMSIMLSVIKSFMNQDARVQVWAYDKNRLFRTYRKLFDNLGIETVIGMEGICSKIRKLKECLTAGKVENSLIVLIGMDRICVDFDYISVEKSDTEEKNSYSDAIEKGRAKSEDDQKQIEILNAFGKMWAQIELQLKEEGKSADEINIIKREMRKEYVSKNYVKPRNLPLRAKPQNTLQGESHQEHNAYNAKSDFEFVIKQGSRFGRHFLLNLNSLADLRATGLKLEFFRYKTAFQLSVDDSRSLFNSKIASTLPEHICQFDDTLESYSFRPFLHEGVEWDGWYMDNGKVVSPYENNEE